jgi:hypothetical protein
MYGGCHLTRDTAALIASVSGSGGRKDALFASLEVARFTQDGTRWEGLDWLTAPHVVGVARKAPAPPPVIPTPARAPGTVMRMGSA